jgi:PAS domain S-box-containing protein
MTVPHNSRLMTWLAPVPVLTGLSVALIGCLVLLGWSLAPSALKGAQAGWPLMGPVAALGFILTGLSLWLSCHFPQHRAVRVLAYLCAALVLLLSGAALYQYFTGWDTGLDRWLLPSQRKRGVQSLSGRLPLSSGVNFLLTGAALLLLRWETRCGWRPAQLLAFVAGMIALQALMSFGYQVRPAGQAAADEGAVVSAAALFITLAAGILVAHPDRGLMRVVTSRTAGGLIARRLWLAAVVIPFVLGWLRLEGERAGWYDTAFGVSLSSAVMAVLFLALIWRDAGLLSATDLEKQQAAEKLRQLNEELERRVEQRTEDLAAASERLRQSVSERRRTEDALRAMHERLRLHIEKTPLAVIEYREFRVRLWSPQAEKIFGWRAEEVMGRRFDEWPFVDAEDLAAVKQGLARLADDAELSNVLHSRNYTKDGGLVNCEWYSSALKDENGEQLSVLSLLLDVTKRRRAEEALQQSEERLQVATSAASIGVWHWNLESQEMWWSEQFSRLRGLPPRTQGKSHQLFLESIHSADREAARQAMRRAIEARAEFVTDFRCFWPGEPLKWLRAKGRAFYSADGQPQRMLGVVLDVTEEKSFNQTKEQLLVREKAARAAAEQSAEIVRRLQAVSDIALTRLEISALLQELLQRVCELLETDAAAILLLDEAEQSLRVHAALGLEGEVEAGIRIPLGQGVAGRIAAARAPLIVSDLSEEEVFSTVLREHIESLIGVPLLIEQRLIGVMHTGTAQPRHFSDEDLRLLQLVADRVALAIEQARLYQVEQQARQQAETVSRMKDEFLATISHEIRMPLNAIIGWISLLRHGRLSQEEAEHALETIERNARAQGRIISDLLDVSSAVTGKLRLDVRPVMPASQIEQALEAARPAAETKHITLDIELDTEAGPVWADADRWRQIAWNLLSNAIKFTPQGGRVQARLRRVDGEIEFLVRDTGRGIAPEFLPYVFERFRQADSSSTRRFGGLGLGLAIVRHLVELHGGSVRAESAGENQGATFVVTLPMLAAREQATESREQHQTNGLAPELKRQFELQGLRVLVVEDDQESRRLLDLILTQSEAEVKSAASGAEALALLESWWPEVVISDIEMPEMNGYEFIRRVREREAGRRQKPAAVALTAHTRVEDRLRALSAGFQMHMPKPFEAAELLTVIASLTGRLGKNGAEDGPRNYRRTGNEQIARTNGSDR